jgi:periplasmic protein TonB
MFAGLDVVHTHPARRWTALVSFTLQAALVGTALVLPLLKPASLPEAFARRVIFRPVSAGIEHPHENQNATSHIGPSQAPVFPIVVRTGPPIQLRNMGPSNSGVSGPPQIVTGDPNSTITSLLNTENARPVPRPPASIHHAAPVSVIMEGNLIHKVEPRYPVIAQQARIQGTVVIKALISRTGTIEHAEAESGQPLLAGAALAAVREWRYKPYYLNGEPVEVETEITVNFVLNR